MAGGRLAGNHGHNRSSHEANRTTNHHLALYFFHTWRILGITHTTGNIKISESPSFLTSPSESLPVPHIIAKIPILPNFQQCCQNPHLSNNSLSTSHPSLTSLSEYPPFKYLCQHLTPYLTLLSEPTHLTLLSEPPHLTFSVRTPPHFTVRTSRPHLYCQNPTSLYCHNPHLTFIVRTPTPHLYCQNPHTSLYCLNPHTSRLLSESPTPHLYCQNPHTSLYCQNPHP